MALLAAYGVNQLSNKKWIPWVLAAIVLEGVLNQKEDYFIKPENKPLVQLESVLDNYMDRSDLLLINSGDLPTPMYMAHRKGWVNYNEQILDTAYLAGLKLKGLSHVLILKRGFGTAIELPYSCVYGDENYSLFSINPK